MLGPRPNPGAIEPPGGEVKGRMGGHPVPLSRSGVTPYAPGSESSAELRQRALRNGKGAGAAGGARGSGNDRSATEGAGPAARLGGGGGRAQSPPRTEPQGCCCSAPVPQWRRAGAAGPSRELCPWDTAGCAAGSSDAAGAGGGRATLDTGGLGSFIVTGNNGAVGSWCHRATGLARIASIDLKDGKNKAFYLSGTTCSRGGISSVRGI
ncbi:unnamed protein product [Coccothraustes coccothraustes]